MMDIDNVVLWDHMNIDTSSKKSLRVMNVFNFKEIAKIMDFTNLKTETQIFLISSLDRAHETICVEQKKEGLITYE